MKLLHAIAVCLIVAMGAGCNKSPTAEELNNQKIIAAAKSRAEAENTIRPLINGQFAKAVQAVVANDAESFKTVLNATTRQDGLKTGGTWTVMRIMMGAGGLKPDDLRINAITLNDELTMAMVMTCHREKGEWKKDAKPQIWILEDGAWRWMP
jgi:hypothetical protein